MSGAPRPGHVDRARLAGEGAARIVTDGDAPSDSDRTLSPAASVELNYEECVDARFVPPLPSPFSGGEAMGAVSSCLRPAGVRNVRRHLYDPL